jgi:hypothetical protein
VITASTETAQRVPPERRIRHTFMTPGELVLLRRTVLRVPQDRVAEQLVDPSTGMPLTRNAVSHYETGLRPVPLWVARRIRDLADAARAYDAKRPTS